MESGKAFWYYLLAVTTCFSTLPSLSSNAQQATEKTPAPFNRPISEDTAEINQKQRIASRLSATDPDSSRKLFYETIEESKRARYPDGVAMGLFRIGMQSVARGMFQEGILFFEEAKPYALLSSNKENIIGYFMNMGVAWFNLGDYKKANALFHSALAKMKELGLENANTTMIYNNLAAIQLLLGQNDKALKYFDESEAVSRKNGYLRPLSMILNNKGSIYVDAGKFDTARHYFTESLNIARKENSISDQVAPLVGLGNIEMKTNNPEKALKYLNEANSISKGKQLETVQIKIAFYLGKAYFQLRRFKEAESILAPALEKARTIGFQDEVWEAEITLAEIYKELGQPLKAYQHLEAAFTLKDSLFTHEKTNAINELDAKYRSSEKDKAIAQSQLIILQQKNKIQSKNLWLIGVTGGTIVLSVISFGLYRRSRYKRLIQETKYRALEHEKDLRVMQAMIKGEEKERERMARELHDGIGGMLTSLGMQFGILRRNYPVLKEAPDYGETMQLLEDTTAEVRKTAHNLMPELLLQYGFSEAVRLYCLRIEKGGKLHINFESLGMARELPAPIALSFYRIVQELVQNIIKHSEADTALVQISKNDSLISILVEDNGSGLLPERQNGGTAGMGMQNLQWRVKAMEGQMNIESRPGEGTSVYLEFDLERMLLAGS